ncbi:MAG: phage holin, partial [Thomasclavelia ramosa]
MKKINWKERFKNKIFWVNTILAVATPILAYFG